MKIQFTARHFAPTEDIRQRATAHIERLARFEDIMHAEIVLTEEHKLSRTVRSAEFIVKVFNGVLTTKSEGAQFTEAIDAVASKLETQLKKHKEKHSEGRRRNAKRIATDFATEL